MQYTDPSKQKEGIFMQTTFYTFTANEIIVTGDGVEQVSGDNARRMVYLRHSEPAIKTREESNLIDFTAWCAEHEVEAVEEKPQKARLHVWQMLRRMMRNLDLDKVLSLALIAVSLFACVGIVF